jgi:hypothetical protein
VSVFGNTPPTISSGSLGTYYLCTNTASVTMTMPATGTLATGWYIVVRNQPTSTNNVTCTTSSAATIVVVAPGTTATLVYDGGSITYV